MIFLNLNLFNNTNINNLIIINKQNSIKKGVFLAILNDLVIKLLIINYC